MGKYIKRTVFSLAIIAIGGHYYYWDKASREIEHFIHERIEEYKNSMPHVQIEANYTLKRTGYPLTATVEATNYSINAQMLDNSKFQSHITGDLKMWTSISAPTTINILMTDTNIQTVPNNASTSPATDITIKITAIKGKASPLNHTYDVSIEDTDVHVSTTQMDEQRIFTINNIKFSGQDILSENQPENTTELRNVTQSFAAEGMTFLNPESKETTKLDLLSFKSIVNDFPMTHPAVIETQKISTLPVGTEVSTVELKEKLIDLVNTMREAKSTLRTEDLRVKMDNLDVTIESEASIDANNQPDVMITATLANQDVLFEKIPTLQNFMLPLMVAQTSDEEGNTTYHVTVKDGILNLGKMPMMRIPSIINDIIPQIPDTFTIQ